MKKKNIIVPRVGVIIIEDDKILRERELPLDMEIEVSLEETDIVIGASADRAPDQDFDLDDKEQDEKEKLSPQIFLLSSGEITPEFEIRFYILGVETSYFVKGRFDGTLETEISDL